MKISSETLRRLRAERGWPQEQLAKASGISLRTIQRVEANGSSSLSTAVSIAAALNVNLKDIQENDILATKYQNIKRPTSMIVGLMLLTISAISESGRLPGAQSDYFFTVNVLCALAGLLILAPSLILALKQRAFIGASLIFLGSPLLTLFFAANVYWLLSGRSPQWLMLLCGIGGVVILYMAMKELKLKNVTF